MPDPKINQEIKGKSILITGGTGSFGHQILRELLALEPRLVTVFSRDEKKQYEMALSYRKRKDLCFVIGDIRDLERIREVMRDVDIVFHAAALKQVPNCEYAPLEAVKTNIDGAGNVKRVAIESGVKIVVSISTDKAVKPVNVMGMTKAIQERIMLSQAANANGKTKFVCVRYGNVLGSRGSAVPLFFDCVQKKMPLPITNPDMTRFQLTLKEAVQLVLRAMVQGEDGDLWVQKMSAARIPDLGRALAEGLTGEKEYPVQIIGMRPGEKIHEVLVSEEEMWRATELENYFIIPSWAKSQTMETSGKMNFGEYTSAGTHLLTREEIMIMLESDGWFGPDAKNKAIRGVEISEI